MFHFFSCCCLVCHIPLPETETFQKMENVHHLITTTMITAGDVAGLFCHNFCFDLWSSSRRTTPCVVTQHCLFLCVLTCIQLLHVWYESTSDSAQNSHSYLLCSYNSHLHVSELFCI
jgi:hypothetical protein